MNLEQKEIVSRLVDEFENKLRVELESTMEPNEHLKLKVSYDATVITLPLVEVEIEAVGVTTTLLQRHDWKIHQRSVALRPATIDELKELLLFFEELEWEHPDCKKLINHFIECGNLPTNLDDINIKAGRVSQLNRFLRARDLVIGLRMEGKKESNMFQFFILVPIK